MSNMADLYRCIGCGFESEKNKVCSCPECGYKMLPLPYDRKTALIKEIRDFVIGNEITYLRNNDVEYKGKFKDDNRFPTFDKIQNYVCSARRTEVFFDNYDESLKNLKTFLHTPFRNNYEVSIDALKKRMSVQEEKYLKEILRELNINETVVNEKLPGFMADYQEIPNESLLKLADELIDRLAELSHKLKQFIRTNNTYNEEFKQIFHGSKRNKNLTDEECLKNEIEAAERMISKKYVVDLFEDGSKEAAEMARMLWSGMRRLMELPILAKQYIYHFDDNTVCIGDEYKAKLLGCISRRYSAINSVVQSDQFLTDLDEDKLFDLYNAMIVLDDSGIMKVNKNHLIRTGESERELNKLIGLRTIKGSIQKIKAYCSVNKNSDALNLHMCFLGNPGTGKTEVARIIAGILHENKILPTDKVVETDRAGMIGQYVGETPQKVMSKVHQAMGGVLFIDEAYALVSGPEESHFDYGHEAVATLIKAMEDYRGRFCVILAGYKNPMEKMLKTNPGFVSRIQFTLDFPNYSRDELSEITSLLLEKRKYTITDSAREKILDVTDVKRKEENFANAREIRNILDQVIMCQNLRSGGSNREIAIADVNKYIKDANINVPVNADNPKHILTGEEELDELIGLTAVKKMVRKINAYAKRNVNSPDFNIHMCFYGNPGTGKTEVARILSRILYDAGVLSEAKVVETDAFGLIGQAIGTTGPKTKAKIADAMGGVLFIDEAYALTGGNRAGTATYGAEAISVLLKEMEDKRGQFCVILAGYKDEMRRMISANPGFESRIQFTLEFPDYTREELGEIAEMMLHKKKYTVTEEALSRILDITDYERTRPNYANARNVRNILDQVILNQNLRTDESGEQSSEIILSDVEEYIEEKGLIINKSEADGSPVQIDINELKDDYYDFDQEIDMAYISSAVISVSGPESQGTAFIISKDGICLSCAHCIEGNGEAQKARVSLQLANGKTFNMYTGFKLIRKDEENDIAVFKLEEEMEYSYLPLLSANYKYTPLKEFIMAGFPFGGESYQSISFTDGRIASENLVDNRKVVFADMFGKPGNSGSPILDAEKHKVIGIYWGGIKDFGTSEIIPCFTPLQVIWDCLSGGQK